MLQIYFRITCFNDVQCLILQLCVTLWSWPTIWGKDWGRMSLEIAIRPFCLALRWSCSSCRSCSTPSLTAPCQTGWLQHFSNTLVQHSSTRSWAPMWRGKSIWWVCWVNLTWWAKSLWPAKFVQPCFRVVVFLWGWKTDADADCAKAVATCCDQLPACFRRFPIGFHPSLGRRSLCSAPAPCLTKCDKSPIPCIGASGNCCESACSDLH